MAPAVTAAPAPAVQTTDPAAPAPAAGQGTPSAPAANVAPAPAAAPPPAAESVASLPDEPLPRRRHSTGMMVGGIVMVSFVPIALLTSLVANAEQTVCEVDEYDYGNGTPTYVSRRDCDDYDPTIYGGLIAAAALAGVGIPFIVIGGKKEPVTARVTPWATISRSDAAPSLRAAGVGLRIDM